MTPHIEANKSEIAKTVIMPGDPLRAQFIAEHYLENYRLVNKIRNIYAYTGYYKGVRVTIMASGMGMPSMGIYSYELYKFYDVQNIIRIGSAGAYTSDLKLYDIVLEESCYSDSTFALVQNNCKENILHSDKELNDKIIEVANELKLKINPSTIYCSDVFYKEEDNYQDYLKKYGCVACEMESFALFHNANVLNKKATCLLTISDNFVTKDKATPLERQNSFTKMMELALEVAIKL